jgi:hypothetical protein
MTPVQMAKPLPECQDASCGRPVRRATYLANGGLCTACRTRRDAQAAQLTISGSWEV